MTFGGEIGLGMYEVYPYGLALNVIRNSRAILQDLLRVDEKFTGSRRKNRDLRGSM